MNRKGTYSLPFSSDRINWFRKYRGWVADQDKEFHWTMPPSCLVANTVGNRDSRSYEALAGRWYVEGIPTSIPRMYI